MSAQLARQLAVAAPFAGASPETIEAVAAHARELRLAANEVLLAEGDEFGGLYVLIEGRLQVLTGQQGEDAHKLAMLDAGAVLGEIAALAGGRREATVVAHSAAVVVAIEPAGVELLLERKPEVARSLADLAMVRLHEAELARQLQDLFPDVDETTRKALLAGVDWVRLAAGEPLVRRGDPADAAYVVVYGRLRVVDDAAEDGNPGRAANGTRGVGATRGVRASRPGDLAALGEPSAEVGAGELVGESALLDDGVRNATLVAIRETRAARLSREHLLQALAGRPAALLGIARTALRRAAEFRGARGGTRRCVALVAVSPQVDLPQVARRTLACLAPTDSATLLTAGDADAALGRPGLAAAEPEGPAAYRLAQWLQKQEQRHQTLLLHADGAHPAWHDVALQHADHVVLVADASADPAPTAAEGRVRSVLSARQGTRDDHTLTRESLVLVHPDRGPGAEAPHGSARWGRVRSVDAILHIRRGHRGDLARLARWLAERPIAVVLSGGGARGFAHLGAVRALEDAGVPIDLLGGTSIGAAMATFVALGHPADERLARAKATLQGMMDWTPPVAALVKGARMTALAERQVAGRDIEDLWLPWFAVSTNVSRADLAVHRHGPLLKALRASTAIPGVVPPVVYGDELHVDGGVLDNLPIRTMRQLNPRGPVVAVDVAETEGLHAPDDLGLSMSGWGLLARRLLPGVRSPRVPTLATTLTRSMLAGSSRERELAVAEGHCDLYLRLDLPRCGLLDFNEADRLEEAGYRAAAPRARQWAKELTAAGGLTDANSSRPVTM